MEYIVIVIVESRFRDLEFVDVRQYTVGQRRKNPGRDTRWKNRKHSEAHAKFPKRGIRRLRLCGRYTVLLQCVAIYNFYYSLDGDIRIGKKKT